ncbi:MAG: hypothetical protein AAB875_05260, partial [Patescibacteria group bacterium]
LDVSNKLSNLKTYLVSITVQIPYPKTFEFRKEATTIAPAVSRAIKELRKELKGRKLKQMSIRAIQL